MAYLLPQFIFIILCCVTTSKGVIRQPFWLSRDQLTPSLRSTNLTLKMSSLNPVHLADQYLSVKSVMATINNKYTIAVKELRTLKHILDTINTEHQMTPHPHPHVHQSLQNRIAQRLAIDINHFTSIQSLQSWIKHEATNADKIP
ncbi:hypothetical protein C8R48DRAFT_674019 [Suillus tomentosus]|nr:hypothetical protein C8R48DRAFT_674019 [Suillus tomentosus]